MWLHLVLLASLFLASCLGQSVEQTPADGVLKVLISGVRRTILESSLFSFDRAALKVLCRSMGLPTEDVSAERRSYNTSDTGQSPVLLNLVCNGNETDIDKCNEFHTAEIETLEREYKTVSLSCRDLELKLMFGSDNSGLVLAKQGDKYYPICVDFLFFNKTWAGAVCRTLGLPSSVAVAMYPYKYYNETSTSQNRIKIAVQMQLDCPSTDMSSCRVRTTDSGEYCRSYIAAYQLGAVFCTDVAPEYRRTNMLPGDIGRLEIKLGDEWSTVCSSVTGIAEVACRSLNLPSTDAREYKGLYNGGDIAFSSSNLYCGGNISTIADCKLAQFGKPCPNNQYLGLSCATAYERKVRVYGYNEGSVQVYHNQHWRGVGVSSSSSLQNVATVICRSVNMSTSVVKSSERSFNASLWLPSVQCDGSEADLFSCPGTDLTSIVNSTMGTGLIVTCDMGDEEIRLQSDGRLEIRHNGIWGTMCAKKLRDGLTTRVFRNLEASVICKGLDKPSTLASANFPSNPSNRTGPVWLDDFRCDDSTTSWENCSHGAWGDVDCSHNNDVFIKCEELNESSISYRLSPGPFPHFGIYEMSLNGVWGTICQDYRLQRNIDPKVLCRSLKMQTDGARMTSKALTSLFQYKSTQIWLDFLNCTGSESSPLDCKHWYIGDSACLRRQVDSAGVYCGPPQTVPDFSVRLVDGPNNSSGRLEMSLYGQWRTICGRNFTKYSARVVCRQLGLPTEMVTVEDKKYKQGTGKIWNLVVDCRYSFYKSVESCSYTTISETLCDHSNDVGIQCSEYKFATFSPLDFGDDHVPEILGGVLGGTAAVFIIGVIIFLIVWKKHYQGRTIRPPVYATQTVAYMPTENGIKMAVEGGKVSNSKS